MKRTPLYQKDKLPYSLLLDPAARRAAAYTNTHQVITEDASARLIAFAETHQRARAAFDPALHDAKGKWRPLPAWATPDVIPRLEIVWIRRPGGDAADEAWLEIPPA